MLLLSSHQPLHCLHFHIKLNTPSGLVHSLDHSLLNNSWKKLNDILQNCVLRAMTRSAMTFLFLDSVILLTRDKTPQFSGLHLRIILSLLSIKTSKSFSCKYPLSQLPLHPVLLSAQSSSLTKSFWILTLSLSILMVTSSFMSTTNVVCLSALYVFI